MTTRGILVAVLVAAAISLRLILLWHGWPQLDSDEAVTGLMARHIAFGHERPVYFWGANYMGALQAYLAAPLLARFGSTAFVLHLVPLALSAGFIACMYFVGRAAYGHVTGLLTLIWLAMGPSFALMRELMAGCGYQDALLFGTMAVLGVWLRLRSPKQTPEGPAGWSRLLAAYAAIGLAMGIACWSDPLILPTEAVALIALAAARRREVVRAGLALLAGFVLGAWPTVSLNVRNGFPTVREVARASGGTAVIAERSAAETLLQVQTTLAVGLPVIFGSPRVCVSAGGVPPTYPPALAKTVGVRGGACDAANVLFSLGVLAVYGAAGWVIVRAIRARFLKRAADAAARTWLRVMLVAGAGIHIMLYMRSPDGAAYELYAARFLLPVYISAPVVFGTLWNLARSPRRATDGPARRAIGVCGLTALLALGAASGITTMLWSATGPFGLPVPPRDAAVIDFLNEHGVTAFYADYWMCYLPVFETGERLQCAVRGQDEPVALALVNNRYATYVDALAGVARPGYIFAAGSDADLNFETGAAVLHLPHEGYRRAAVAGYAVYVPPGARALGPR